ncbi:unnamed protein product [Closterium sp. NIES-53]
MCPTFSALSSIDIYGGVLATERDGSTGGVASTAPHHPPSSPVPTSRAACRYRCFSPAASSACCSDFPFFSPFPSTAPEGDGSTGGVTSKAPHQPASSPHSGLSLPLHRPSALLLLRLPALQSHHPRQGLPRSAEPDETRGGQAAAEEGNAEDAGRRKEEKGCAPREGGKRRERYGFFFKCLKIQNTYMSRFLLSLKN